MVGLVLEAQRMSYEVGVHVERLDGRPLFAYVKTCPLHPQNVTMHHTRAVTSPQGDPLEIEVCDTCGRVQKVTKL